MSFAIRAYAKRNSICHTGIYDLQSDKKWAELGLFISSDLERISSILPDDRVRDADNWKRLMTYTRDRLLQWNASMDRWEPNQGLDIAAPKEMDIRTASIATARTHFNARKFRLSGQASNNTPCDTATLTGRSRANTDSILVGARKRKFSEAFAEEAPMTSRSQQVDQDERTKRLQLRVESDNLLAQLCDLYDSVAQTKPGVSVRTLRTHIHLV